jgi:hypothetical protein
MENQDNVDSVLETMLKKIGAVREISTQENPIGQDSLRALLSPVFREAIIGEYTAATNEISYDIVYESLAPPIKHAKLEDLPKMGSRPVGVMKNSEYSIVRINPQGATFIDGDPNILGRPPVAIDLRLATKLPASARLSIDSQKRGGKRLRVHRLVYNYYRVGLDNVGVTIFLSTNKKGTEGYLLVADDTIHGEFSLDDLLNSSRSASKAKDLVDAETLSNSALYRISNGGRTKTYIPIGPKESRPYDFQAMSGFLFSRREFEIKGVEAFVSGHPASFKDLLTDINEITLLSAKTYLKNVKPSVSQGMVEYTSPMSGKISQELDAFLEKVKDFYDGDKELAKKMLFSAPALTPISSDGSQMYR